MQELIERISKMKGYTSFQGETIVKEQVLNLIGELDEPQKVVIPQFVAEWIEYVRRDSRKNFRTLRVAINHLFIDYPDNERICEWREEAANQELLARAWLDGYSVEQEKLYTVEIPNPHHDGIIVLEKVGDDVIMSQMDNYLVKWQKEPEYQLTAAEIRKDFEWAWKWAEEVKEVGK